MQNRENTMNEMVKLAGLWKHQDKDGQMFLSGSLNPISKILVIPNTDKKEKKDPDYFFYLGADEKKESFEPKPIDDL
jgi:hypothetical protein